MPKKTKSLEISRILHAGYIFNYNDTKIMFDPIFENPFSYNCYAYPNVQFDHEVIKKLKFDAVFISHYHDDHCSLESLHLLERKTPIYIYCVHEEIFLMIKKLGFENVYSLKLNTSIIIGSIEIIPLPALDREVDSIFHIKAGELNILNVVDSWIDPETLNTLKKTLTWDMILWPFQTMRELEVLCPSRVPVSIPELPIEWIEQLNILNPKYIIPSSCQFIHEDWSWYNQALFPISYQKFAEEINILLPQTKIIRLNPANSISIIQNSVDFLKPLSWIQPIGNQDIDYSFNPNLKVPSTSDISKHFNSLNNQQAEMVYQFCRSNIIEKYNSIGYSNERYFDKTRLWRLSIYDHLGIAQHFYYKLHSDKIEHYRHSDFPLSWTTEVPIAKLYGALYNGETLTSMYIRINDTTFCPEIENEIKSVDIFEDPLIRCLFHGNFGAYQNAQLKNILARME